ncbi:hypothetical protein HY643_03650, partial [Candidatus Woesearchaeota archaeon]|nr:hypothetical protein [Candidatus Woesearchaeota archaeon]
KKYILINPLTFLFLELHKAPTKISEEDTNHLSERVQKEGLSPEVKKLVSYLGKFDAIGLSSGNLQGPNPKAIELAAKFFWDYVAPEINKHASIFNRPNIYPQNRDGRFESETLLKLYGASCVGRIRTLVEEGKLNPSCYKQATKAKPKQNSCSDIDNQVLSYFKKHSGNTHLFISLCASVGGSPYTSHRTDLTLEKMENMEPEQISEAIQTEKGKIKKTLIYRMLCGYIPRHKWIFSRVSGKELEKELDDEKRFGLYVEAAENLIKAKTGKEVSMIKNTYTFDPEGECSDCELCNTVALELNKAGVTPDEWQSHLEQKFAATKI